MKTTNFVYTICKIKITYMFQNGWDKNNKKKQKYRKIGKYREKL